MTGAMPELQQEDLLVSEEEERYLRSAFRRFALPYLMLVITITMGAVMWTASSSTTPEDGSDEFQSIVSEAASLREAVSALRQELHAQATDSGDRLGQLEGGLERLRAGAGGESPAELANRLDHAHQRINALEGRLRELESQRAAAAPAPRASAPLPASPEPAWPTPTPAQP